MTTQAARTVTLPLRTEEHDLGALVIAVSNRSVDNYIMIRQSHYGSRRGREWRVDVKRYSNSDRRNHTSTGDSLIAALQRALVFVNGWEDHEGVQRGSLTP